MGSSLDGKVAIVTGAASGIGRATAALFASEGASVVIGDISDDAGEQLARELGASAAYVHADVTQEASVERLVAASVERFGRLDVMFNNAGAVGDVAGFLDLDGAALGPDLQLLVGSVALGHKHAARQMREQGQGGSIISTSSIAGVQGGWGPTAYTGAKAAVIGLVRQAAAELGRYGIRSNAICPGVIPTPLMVNAFGVSPERAGEFLTAVSDALVPLAPIGRAGRPEDIAQAALWLAGDHSTFVTGQALVVDGGATAVSGRDHGSLIAGVAERFGAHVAGS